VPFPWLLHFIKTHPASGIHARAPQFGTTKVLRHGDRGRARMTKKHEDMEIQLENVMLSIVVSSSHVSLIE